MTSIYRDQPCGANDQVQLFNVSDEHGGGLPKSVRQTKTRRTAKNIIKTEDPCNGLLGSETRILNSKPDPRTRKRALGLS